jgi:dCMP deaminase
MIESTRGCENAEHAERNAIAYAARYGTALEGSDLYVTHAPCLACARTIISAGISIVTFTFPYRLTEGVELLEKAGIKVLEMSIHK